MEERGLTIESLCQKRKLNVENLKEIYSLKGLQETQKINSNKIDFDFETVRYLISIGYTFNKQEIVEKDLYSVELYSLICWNILKLENFSEDEKRKLKLCITNKDIKATKSLFPFMKEIKKRKIMTFLCCVRTKIPKEISCIILDYAYSPINERGFICCDALFFSLSFRLSSFFYCFNRFTIDGFWKLYRA